MCSLLDRYNDFRAFVASQFSEKTQTMVDDALRFAANELSDKLRYDGTPMLDHDVAVARIVAEDIGLGRNSTIAAIVHDVVRIAVQSHDPRLEELTTYIRNQYGEEVLGIALSLCKISDIKLKRSKEQASDFRDMIVSYSEDPRVILVKLADRLEVMRSLDIFPEKKRLSKSWESLNLYAEIAHKLGLYTIKSEMEDLSLKYIEPEAYNHILDCDLLIIDDLGTELSNSFSTSQLFLCINERFLRKKSTMISTNLSLSKINETYSERTFSRLSGNYKLIKLTGEDIRRKKRRLKT